MPRLGRDAGACCSVDCVLLVSSAMMISLSFVVPSSLQTRDGASEHPTDAVEWKRSSAIVMRCAIRRSVIANLAAKLNA